MLRSGCVVFYRRGLLLIPVARVATSSDGTSVAVGGLTDRQIGVYESRRWLMPYPHIVACDRDRPGSVVPALAWHGAGGSGMADVLGRGGLG